MKYALLVYDVRGSWHNLSTEQRQAMHREYQALAEVPGVIGHYRLRPPEMTTTIRVDEGQVKKAGGLSADTRGDLRAIYLLESDDHDSVFGFAARIPAARRGGAVDVRPLAGP